MTVCRHMSCTNCGSTWPHGFLKLTLHPCICPSVHGHWTSLSQTSSFRHCAQYWTKQYAVDMSSVFPFFEGVPLAPLLDLIKKVQYLSIFARTSIEIQVIPTNQTSLPLSYVEAFLWFYSKEKPEYSQKANLSELRTIYMYNLTYQRRDRTRVRMFSTKLAW